MDKEKFEKLVAQAIEEMPEEFREKLENIDVVVEDYPSRRQLRETGMGRGLTLLGLYEGVPLTRRRVNYGLVPPDKVTIFQKTIEDHYRSGGEDEIKKQIQRVVYHEIAHHFGIGDARLREIEKDR